MNRLMILAAATTMLGVGELTHGFLADPPVNLQATTPGTQQTGYINVSGTVLAGTFYGSSGGTSTKVVSGWATSATGFVFGGDFRTASSDGRGIFASATSATGSSYGGDFRSASPNGRGIFGYATSPTGLGIGGDFRSDSQSGTGIIGRVTSTNGACVGGFFSTLSPDGVGIQAQSAATSGDTFAGVFDSSASTSTAATGLFRQNAVGGFNVVGLHTVITSATGSASKSIYAEGKKGFGVFAEALGSGGYGIYCEGQSRGISAVGDVGVGVRGQSNNSNNYGVYGTIPSAGAGAAIFADGVLAAAGTKTMRIDHPDDPENKYLLQYCSEGDTPQLQYRGTVTLDGAGAATVNLPSYFDKINRDPSYQLTAIGAAMPNLHIGQEINHNMFKIAGGKGGAKVSWTVIGIRNDRFVQAYGAKTEVDKPEEARGTYLRPELYNKPANLKETYDPRDVADRNGNPVALSPSDRHAKR